MIGRTNAGGGGGIDITQADAQESEVLAGKKFYAGNKDIKIGTMPIYDGATEITKNGTINTAKKYIESDLIINISSAGGTDVSDTTATASDVKYGKVFHLSNGNRAVGTVGTFTAQEVTYNRTLNTNGKIVDGDIVINIGGGDIKQNDLNAVMTGNFYDILTDSFIDQIMTGHYIKKGE